MISYDLAKELKDTGWPQVSNCEGYLLFIFPNGRITSDEDYRDIEGLACYAPSLSELIAACPPFHNHDRFCLKASSLNIWCSGYMFPAENAWAWRLVVRGDTPEEAVARLWLKLRAKP